jgi:hypothetical protein
MTDRSAELEAAAKDINPASLQSARIAIAALCTEYLHWAELFNQRLEILPMTQRHKFARAFSLTLLGHLPTRPDTCPFCIQYGRDRACTSCGYAATHGRCDAEDSSFSLFIESFQELGRLIFQDTTGSKEGDPQTLEEKRLLFSSLQESSRLARQMQEKIVSLSALQLMEQKQIYIGQMIELIPLCIFSDDVKRQFRLLQHRLKGYW